MSLLKRIGDFTTPKDQVTGAELRRQLVKFEGNVSDMSDSLSRAAMARLSRGEQVANANRAVVKPGQFLIVDTRTGTFSAALAKPSTGDSGTFVVFVDVGGGAGSIYVQAQSCKYNGVTTAFLTVANFAALIFCDGTDYWRVS